MALGSLAEGERLKLKLVERGHAYAELDREREVVEVTRDDGKLLGRFPFEEVREPKVELDHTFILYPGGLLQRARLNREELAKLRGWLAASLDAEPASFAVGARARLSPLAERRLAA